MTDLSPEFGGKLALLIPRLASDSPGEVNATVQAIRRTLDRAGLDLHDLAATLTEAPGPVTLERHAPRDGPSLMAMALGLYARARHRLTERQADFVASSARLLATGRALTPKQANWLRDLHAQHNEGRR